MSVENKNSLARANAEGADEITNTDTSNNIYSFEEYQGDLGASADDIAAAHRSAKRQLARGGRKFSDLSNAQVISAFGGGDVNGDWINVPGPGHSRVDRTLGLKRDDSKPYGFALNSLADDNFDDCLDYVIQTLGLSLSGSGYNPSATAKQAAEKRAEAAKEAAEKKAESFKSQRSKWDSALPRDGGLMERYFAETRGVTMAQGVHRMRQMQYSHNVTVEPLQILTLIEDFDTFEPCGIHRIGVERLASGEVVKFKGRLGKDGKIDWSSGAKQWVTNAGVMRLIKGDAQTDTLFVAEGIETAYSFQKLPLGVEQPAIWSLVFDGNYKKLKPLRQFKRIYIAVDIEPSGAGEKAAQTLAANWAAAGKEVYLVRPILEPDKAKRDLNDIVFDCAKEQRAPVEDRDYTVEKLEPDAAEQDDSDEAEDDPNPAGGHAGAHGTLDEAIERLNREHAFVMEGGHATVFRTEIDPVTKIRSYVRYQIHDFKLKFANVLFQVGTRKNAKEISLGEAWIKSPMRLEYLNGVVFDPANRYGAGYKNLWQGFAYEPRPGNWDLLREHVRLVICGGSETVCQWRRNSPHLGHLKIPQFS